MSHFDDWCEGCRITGLELYELESKGSVSLYEMRRLPDNDPFRHNLSYAIWDGDDLIMTTRNLMYAYQKYDECVKNHRSGYEIDKAMLEKCQLSIAEANSESVRRFYTEMARQIVERMERENEN